MQEKIVLEKEYLIKLGEDSTTITLPAELGEIWQGCGGSVGTSEAAMKAFVQWDVLSGELAGARADRRTDQ